MKLLVSDITYEERKAFVIPLIDIPDKQTIDKLDIRWVKCSDCGKIAPCDDFVFYGGSVHYNRGICKSCLRKKHEKYNSGPVSEEKKRAIFKALDLDYDAAKRHGFKRRMWYSEQKGWHWLPIAKNAANSPVL